MSYKPKTWIKGKFKTIDKITDLTWIFVIELDEPFEYKAGQFVNIIKTRIGSKKMMIPISRKIIVFFVRLLNKMNLFGSLISSVSYENIKIDSSFDGSFSSKELNFTYTNLDEIF